MSTFAMATRPFCFATAFSSLGPRILQGPHHLKKKKQHKQNQCQRVRFCTTRHMSSMWLAAVGGVSTGSNALHIHSFLKHYWTLTYDYDLCFCLGCFPNSYKMLDNRCENKRRLNNIKQEVSFTADNLTIQAGDRHSDPSQHRGLFLIMPPLLRPPACDPEANQGCSRPWMCIEWWSPLGDDIMWELPKKFAICRLPRFYIPVILWAVPSA